MKLAELQTAMMANKAVRAARKGNPRVHPCPGCKQPDRLTPQDVRAGYQCDECADREEGCGP